MSGAGWVSSSGANTVELLGLVIEGEPGSGKSTLWHEGVDAACELGHHVLRSEPSVSETDLSYAGLSDLLGKILPQVVDAIPAPQREALEVALLLRAEGAQPVTAHAVGLAVLSALRATAASSPVLVAIDDAHWLDQASLDALMFAVRRLRRRDGVGYCSQRAASGRWIRLR